MNVLLKFIYKGSNYVILKYNDKYYLGRYNSKEFIIIEDKIFFKRLIPILFSVNFDPNKLLSLNIKIVKNKQLPKALTLNHLIELELKNKQKELLENNCMSLYFRKNKIPIIPNLKNKYIIFGSLILVVSLMSFIGVQRNLSNAKNQKKYSLLEQEASSVDYKQDLSLVKIKNKSEDNLFNDTYVKIKFPYDGYTLLNSNESIKMNLYHLNNYPSIAISYVENIDNIYEQYDFSQIEKKYKVSINTVFERNNISNLVDLIYHITISNKNGKKNNMSKNELLDKVVFTRLKNIVLPYDKSSKNNKLICFEGDKYGYAFVTDKNINISLLNDNKEYHIIFQVDNNTTINLTEDQIIEFVSAIQFNKI